MRNVDSATNRLHDGIMGAMQLGYKIRELYSVPVNATCMHTWPSLLGQF